MRLTWQIVRKDLVRFRWLLLAWCLMLAVKCGLYIYVAGVFGAPNLAWLALLSSGQGAILLTVLDPLVIFFFVAAIIFEDPPAHRDAWWMTRPISGLRLLAAKLTLATLAFVAMPTLLGMAWWLACGLDAASIARLAGTLALVYFVIVIISAGVAAATGSFPRHLLWTLVAGTAFILAHVSVRMFSGRDPVVALNSATYTLLLTATVLLVTAWLLWHQYHTRYFRWSAVRVPAVLVAASVFLFSLEFPDVSRSGVVSPAQSRADVSLVLLGRPTLTQFGIVLPVKMDVPSSSVVRRGNLEVTFRSADGHVWKPKGGLRTESSMRLGTRQMLGLPPSTESENDVTQFVIKPAIAQRIASTAISAEVTGTIWYHQLAPEVNVPLQPSLVRFAGGSCSLVNLRIARGRLDALLTLRTSPEAIGFWYDTILLYNPRTGELVRPEKSESLISLTPVGLGFAFVNPLHLVFKLPPEAGLNPRSIEWFKEARFVLAGVEGNSLQRRHVASSLEFPSTPAPGVQFDTSSPLSRVDVKAETLKGYAGRYEPAPGVVVNVSAQHNGLRLESANLPALSLLPVSDSEYYAFGWDLAPGNPMKGARFKFVADASGRVTHFVLQQNGRDYVIPKVH